MRGCGSLGGLGSAAFVAGFILAAAGTQAAAQDAGKAKPDPAAELLKQVKIGGLIEVKAASRSDFQGNDSSDLTLSKVELYFDAKPAEYLSAHIQFIYEDDSGEGIELDEAYAVLGNTKKFPLYVQAGKWALPFGNYDTDMATDPLAKTLGEIKEAAVLLGAETHGFKTAAYAFNGDTARTGDGNRIDQYGGAVGYDGKIGEVKLAAGLGYTNNIADSDGITDALGEGATALSSYVAGIAAYTSVGYKGGLFRAGYLTALEKFDAAELAYRGRGAQPGAWAIEASYTMPVASKDVTLALSAQGTKEVLALALPKRRYGAAVTVKVVEHAGVTLEYLRDEDYGPSEGGTGRDGHTATLMLKVKF